MMRNIEITFPAISHEVYEVEYTHKGFIDGIVVYIDGKKYDVCVYSEERFMLEIKIMMESYKRYLSSREQL